MKQINYILLFIAMIAGVIIATSCDSRGYEYDIPVNITFNGVDANNIVQIAHGVTSFRVTGTITCTQGIRQVGLYNANPKTGVPETNPISGTDKLFDEDMPLKYDFDYTIENIESNKALRIKIVSGDGESFQAGMAVRITPVVEFTLERTLESYDYWYGMYLASWYEGRVYKQRDVEQWASSVDITMGEVNGKPVFVSPDARTKAGRESFVGAKTTKFERTNLTAADFNAVKEIDATPLQNLTATQEMVEVTANTVYSYLTAEGKKGLILVTTLTKANHRDIEGVVIHTIKVRVKKEL